MNSFKKTYMVTGYGQSKEKKEDYSSACRVKIANDGTWGYIDMKERIFLPYIASIGTVVETEETITVS